MDATTIYLDNAATTYPKPPEVFRAQDSYFRHSANPGRGGYRLSLDSARAIFDARSKIADFIGAKDASRLVFTGGCTLSINMALKGIDWRSGDVVVTSSLEHNSVMRPLHQLEMKAGVKIISMPYTAGPVIDAGALSETLKEHRPRLCVVAHASNVTGDVLDLGTIAEVCRSSRVALMVDAAQSAGLCAPRVAELGVALWCTSGHKGLLGPPGVGLLYASEGVELEPLIAGGTGSGSERFEMPQIYPDLLESGTLPGPAIAGLAEGVGWVKERGIDSLLAHECELASRFLSWAASRPDIQTYGPPLDSCSRTGIVAFQMSCCSPDRVADLLDQHFGIAVRSGLHCAALAHRTLGTLATGLVRASFGPFNTVEDVDELCSGLQWISGHI